jgi:tRNA-specific 2-thiouridylase
MSQTIAIALSGGVDSLVAAYLLKEKGYRLFGIHFITGFEAAGVEQRVSLTPIAQQLGVEIEVVDCTDAFRRTVVDYFARSYQSGETPNPCMMCNPLIKFGAILTAAKQRGATRLATGHYARVSRDASGVHHLYKGVDGTKDQSYFLARLTQDQLGAACFPLGQWTKSDVRGCARTAGLTPVAKRESQDVCFVRGTGYREFLAQHYDIGTRPGPIVDTSGRVLGQHQGLHRYTVGQRRGINCPAPEPYYVIRLDETRNRLVVGAKAELKAPGCRLLEMNWIAPPPTQPFRADVRVRYRSAAAPATITPEDGRVATLRFDAPQTALTPGQGGVIYDGEEVLGSGWIKIGSKKQPR